MRVLSQEDVRQQSFPIQQFVQQLGDEVDYYALRHLFWRFGEGNFNDLPLVCICSRHELNGALSGYDAAEDTIFLAKDFVRMRDEAQIVAALIQEVVSALVTRATRMTQIEDSFFELSDFDDTYPETI